MPTAGKAAGAVLFARLGIATAGIIAAGLPSTIPAVATRPVAACIGAVAGWRMTGRRDAGSVPGVLRGVTAGLASALGTTVVIAAWTMLDRAFGGRYRDPMGAVEEAAGLIPEIGRLLLDPAVAAVVVVGGAPGGSLAGRVARRLP